MPIFLSSLLLILVAVSLFTFIVPIQNASAMIDVGWDFSTGHNLGDGATPIGSVANLFNVTDDTSEPDGVFNTPQVTVSSITADGVIKDSITMTLFEVDSPNGPPPFGLNPDDSTGIFVPTNIVFNPDTAQFSIGQSATVTQQDATFAGNAILDTISLQVNSTTTPGGIQYVLKETGPDTGIFTGHLTFSSDLSISNSTIQVSPGDIVTISYNGIPSNVAIVPSPNGSVGGLKADVGDTIRVTYNGHTADTVICTCGGPGGGGGGLIRPGLVLDTLVGVIGGSPYIVSPPSFGNGLLHYSDGLTITQGSQKTIFDTSNYNQDIPTQVMVSGKKVNMNFKTFEAYNPNGVIHMGLYIIPHGQDMITTNSIGSIVYDKNSPVQISDPNHILSDATASISSDGKFQYTTFSFVPTKSYDKMSFLARAWNDHLQPTDIRVHDAIDEPAAPKTLPSGVIQYDDFHNLITILDKGGFKKPQIMEHIHSATDVFPSNEGYVYWLYDSTAYAVTLIISDREENTLYSLTESLINKEIPPKGDYDFMKFTVKQLNREDIIGEQEIMKQEEIKAMEKKLVTEGYHMENGIWIK